jgi:hypothetical protein
MIVIPRDAMVLTVTNIALGVSVLAVWGIVLGVGIREYLRSHRGNQSRHLAAIDGNKGQ